MGVINTAFHSSAYSCHLFLISSASVRSLPFLSFTVFFLVWNVALISPIFLKRSFPFHCSPLCLCIAHFRRASYLSLLFSGILPSVGYVFLLLPFLSLLFYPQLFVKLPQTTTFPPSISFYWEWFWSPPPVQCYELQYIVLQALYIPELIPWIYLSLPLYIHKGFDLVHTWMVQWFSILSSI